MYVYIYPVTSKDSWFEPAVKSFSYGERHITHEVQKRSEGALGALTDGHKKLFTTQNTALLVVIAICVASMY